MKLLTIICLAIALTAVLAHKETKAPPPTTLLSKQNLEQFGHVVAAIKFDQFKKKSVSTEDITRLYVQKLYNLVANFPAYGTSKKTKPCALALVGTIKPLLCLGQACLDQDHVKLASLLAEKDFEELALLAQISDYLCATKLRNIFLAEMQKIQFRLSKTCWRIIGKFLTYEDKNNLRLACKKNHAFFKRPETGDPVMSLSSIKQWVLKKAGEDTPLKNKLVAFIKDTSIEKLYSLPKKHLLFPLIQTYVNAIYPFGRDDHYLGNEELENLVDAYPNITSLDLALCWNLTDLTKLNAKNISSLKTLDLKDCKLNDESLKYILNNCPGITKLELAETRKLTKLPSLHNQKNLTYLNLYKSGAARGLESAFGKSDKMANLTHLDLHATHVSLEKINWENLPHLTYLDVSYTKLTRSVLDSILRSCPLLITLDIRECEYLKDEELADWEGQKNLQKLTCNCLSKKTFKNIFSRCKKLSSIGSFFTTYSAAEIRAPEFGLEPKTAIDSPESKCKDGGSSSSSSKHNSFDWRKEPEYGYGG